MLDMALGLLYVLGDRCRPAGLHFALVNIASVAHAVQARM
jgi:hypothetical protein